MSYKEDLALQIEQFSKVIAINGQMSVRLTDRFSEDNRNLLPGRKPSQISLGAAAFLLGLDYYTYKRTMGLLGVARTRGINTKFIEHYANNPSSWSITMQAGGLRDKKDTEVCFKSFIEEPTGTRQGSLGTPEKLAAYMNFLGDAMMIKPISDKYSGVQVLDPGGGDVIYAEYLPHMFVNLQAMSLAMISVRPGAISDELFRDIPDKEVKSSSIKEGKNFLHRMQLFRRLLRNSLTDQREVTALTKELNGILLGTEGDRSIMMIDVIVGLQSESEIIAFKSMIDRYRERGVNSEVNNLLSLGIEKYLDLHLHLV